MDMDLRTIGLTEKKWQKMNKENNLKQMLEVYFVAGTQNVPETTDLPTVLESVLKAGITCFQFREKGEGSLASDFSALKAMAKTCQKLCQEYRVPFIMNDYVDLAIELNADGVHVGQNDEPIEYTIEKVEKSMWIGYSTNNLEEFLEAETIKGIDYVGIGPAFTPASKEDHDPVMGTSGIKEAMQQRKHLPAVAIGGITPENAHEVWETGVDGLAVVSAIAQSTDIEQTILHLKRSSE